MKPAGRYYVWRFAVTWHATNAVLHKIVKSVHEYTKLRYRKFTYTKKLDQFNLLYFLTSNFMISDARVMTYV